MQQRQADEAASRSGRKAARRAWKTVSSTRRAEDSTKRREKTSLSYVRKATLNSNGYYDPRCIYRFLPKLVTQSHKLRNALFFFTVREAELPQSIFVAAKGLAWSFGLGVARFCAPAD